MVYRIELKNGGGNCLLKPYSSEILEVLSTLKMDFRVLAIDDKVIYLYVIEDAPQQHKFLGYRFKNSFGKAHFCDPQNPNRMFKWRKKRNFSKKDWKIIESIRKII